MTVRAKKFTPEVLLSAPRRSSAIPNQKGTLALFTVSTYSFNSQSKSSEIRVLDIKTGQTNLVSSDAQASEPTWLGKKNLILWLRGGEKGTTNLMLTDGDNLELKWGCVLLIGNAKLMGRPATITSFNGSVANLKITEIDSETFALVVTGLATPSGSLYNPETAEKPKSTGKVYSKLFVRQWDSYVTENTSSIWYTTLKIKGSSGSSNMTAGSLRNALAGSSLESPVPPFGGAGDFDASKNGIVFVAKDPKINAANYTKTDLYFIPLDFTKPRAQTPQIVKTGNLKGYSASPVFSPDGNSVAFTRMKSIQYESDKPRLLLIPDITDLTNVQEFYETPDGEGKWDLRPETITWSQSGEELYVTAEENGRGKLFKLPASPRHAKDLPKAIVSDGTVTDVKLLPNNQLLVSSNSLVDNSTYSILDPETDASSLVSSNSKLGKAFGLSQDQVDEFWFAGAEDYNVHAWVLKPSNFDKSKKYPLAFLIHGGPQGAWNEGWSTRWNPAVFAEQGYVVVTPNPTGSTGYGMEFQNGIKNQWGGRPYIDLVKCFEYIEANISYVDINRAVALGASYGVTWSIGFKATPWDVSLKALVTHDGVFSTLNQYSSEELFFPHHDFDGTLWDNRENYEKWDPARHLKNWATPHLIIHNELDYRLPIAEGLAPFNVLQTKGIDSKFLTFPDENHWVLKPENSLLWHKEVLGWINKYTRIEEEELNACVSQVRM